MKQVEVRLCFGPLALTHDHQQLLRAFRQMLFNIAAHNRDDHGKNSASGRRGYVDLADQCSTNGDSRSTNPAITMMPMRLSHRPTRIIWVMGIWPEA